MYPQPALTAEFSFLASIILRRSVIQSIRNSSTRKQAILKFAFVLSQVQVDNEAGWTGKYSSASVKSIGRPHFRPFTVTGVNSISKEEQEKNFGKNLREEEKTLKNIICEHQKHTVL